MAKCGGCGQFIAASASVRCSKCAGCYHRACVGVPPTATPSPTWLCPGCKATLPRTDNSATPVKGAAADYSDSHSLPTVTPSVSLDLAQEIRAFREELSGLRADIRQLRQENAEFRAANEGYNGRMGAVEGRLDNIEQRFESTDAPTYDHLEKTIADLKLQLNERDQDMLLNDVIVSGIPESKAENPAHIIKAVSLKLGIDLDDRDIVNVERLGRVRRNLTTSSSQNDIAERPRPRAIAVRLSRRVVRDQLDKRGTHLRAEGGRGLGCAHSLGRRY
uniref:SFRICE_028937 n=1 Tax=Spodoptera frugiperda TaxID=7108 RepID=A0A2H1VU39_SPOFR